jgi:hypothetical protein
VNARLSLLLLAWACQPTPAPPEPACGNGVVDQGEACDDGVNDGAYEGCAPDCSERTGWCGDGEVTDGETCDDGVNDGSYGGCLYDCTGGAGACGDGIVNGPEVCDDGVNDGSYNGCEAGCVGVAPACGDGIVNGPESCDDGINDGTCGSCAEDCLTAGFGSFLTQVVVRAAPDAGLFDTPDFYVEVYDQNDILLARTMFVEDMAAPVVIPIEGVEVFGELLTIDVWDADGLGFGDDDPMGTVTIDTTVRDGSARDGELRLE